MPNFVWRVAGEASLEAGGFSGKVVPQRDFNILKVLINFVQPEVFIGENNSASHS